MIPYGRQSVDEDDIQAVVEVLRSDLITQGPVSVQFEKAIAEYCGACYAVAVANGTAALHLAAMAGGFGPGDEVVTSPMTFVASPNCALYCGAKPIFADIDAKTYCIDVKQIRKQLTSATRGIIPVHFAGQPCDMAAIFDLARERELIVIEDAAHAIGAEYKVREQTFKVGSCAHSDMTIFSFHPVKHITCGEGGVVTTNSSELYHRLLLLRNHGITKKPEQMEKCEGLWYYEMQELGFNFRITDFQCALGLSQLKKIDAFVKRRREIVDAYNQAFEIEPELITPFEDHDVYSSYHLYVLQFKTLDRLTVFNALRDKGIGVHVHYIPVHLQPYYRKRFGYKSGDYPEAETYYRRVVTLPLYPIMTNEEVGSVIRAVRETVKELV
jgi:UDP-4-amino-4,6-dideoxy-N-acetyl-beta-L-altrosamine transaminase